MDTAQLARSLAVKEKRQAPADIMEEMRRAGIAPRLLEVTEVEPGLHEIAEGITLRPIYRLSWAKEPVRLFGLWSIFPKGRGDGRFIKLAPQGVNLPAEAKRRQELSQGMAAVDEMAVFLSTRLRDSHLEAILAARVKGEWLELYRWNTSWVRLGLSRLAICQF